MNIKRYLLKILLLFVLVGSVVNADILVVPFYEIHENSVYYRTENGLEKLQNADAKTFEILGYHIAKDKNAVYTLNTDDDKIVTVFSSKENDYKINELSGVNPNTFEMIEPSYFKDDKNVYYFSDKEKIMKKIENADVESFEVLNDDYSKDKNSKYYHGERIK